MSKVQFSVLSYYPSILNDENINVGILFYSSENKERSFYKTENIKRLKNFDDELDIKFLMTYLEGLKEEWEGSLFDNKTDLCMESFIYNYGNELRFGKIQDAEVKQVKDFIETTKKVYLRFDYEKKDRLTEESMKKYIKTLLKSNNVKVSNGAIIGGFNEGVKYDFIVNQYGFKSFIIDDNTELRNQFNNYKGWAYTAQKNKLQNGIKTVFIVDTERRDENYNIAKAILSSEADVIKSSDVISYINNVKMA